MNKMGGKWKKRREKMGGKIQKRRKNSDALNPILKAMHAGALRQTINFVWPYVMILGLYINANVNYSQYIICK